LPLLNAIGDAFSGMGQSFADAAEQEQRDIAAASLINRAPPAPEAKAPASTFVPEADSAGHGNALDKDTVGRAHAVYEGLVKRGLDPHTAIGFAANAVQESRANPATGAGDMGASHGLMQWRAERHQGFTQKFGNSTNLDDHLDYIMHELQGPEARAWRAIQAAADDPGAKAAAVSQFYERPKDTQPEIQRRSYIANRLASQFLRDTSQIALNQ
jgi:hypothetical protein